ncbi:MAG: HlyD family type I secretion periplasmic adaptor subunit [Acuticoccus sp.]
MSIQTMEVSLPDDPRERADDGTTEVAGREKRVRPSDPLALLTVPVLVEETATNRFVRRTALAIAIALLALTVWASLARVHEVSKATGTIVPAGFERVVQHYEGGIVKEILVRSGDEVEIGQPLFLLDDAATAEDLVVATQQKEAIEAEIESLVALDTGRTPQFDRFTAAVAASMRTAHVSQHEALEKEHQLIASRIDQARSLLKSFDAQIAAYADDRRFAEENFARIEALVKKGFSTRALLAERRKAITDVDNAVAVAREKKQAAADRLNEATRNLASFLARTRADRARRIAEMRTALAALSGDVSKQARRRDRLTVASPVRGLVKSLEVTTIGGVVSRGQPLATIVPVGEELTAETRIAVSEIGYIRIGLPVHIKVSAFDFTRFGWIDGTITDISPSSFAEDGEEPYYKVRVALATDHLPSAPSARLSPGMAVDADIITGDKTVLSYIFSPISRAMKSAFVER